jgi:hypothetical protein
MPGQFSTLPDFLSELLASGAAGVEKREKSCFEVKKRRTKRYFGCAYFATWQLRPFTNQRSKTTVKTHRPFGFGCDWMPGYLLPRLVAAVVTLCCLALNVRAECCYSFDHEDIENGITRQWKPCCLKTAMEAIVDKQACADYIAKSEADDIVYMGWISGSCPKTAEEASILYEKRGP